ncbi:MAG: hypothetical protein QOG64_1624 [Acidimicrobiaceae bacterium]|nr:hypothetical protein [Acidimicrobiaceae bacterium]
MVDAGEPGRDRRAPGVGQSALGHRQRSNRVELAALAVTAVLGANTVFHIAHVADDLASSSVIAIAVAGLGFLALPLIGYIVWHWRRLRRAMTGQEVELVHRRAREQAERVEREWVRARVEEVLTGAAEIVMHFQPIVDLHSERVVGHEALARFAMGSPEQWFASAAEAGLGVELEVAAVNVALRALGALDGYVSINASPATLLSDTFWSLLQGSESDRVVIELTEHVRVEEYGRYEPALARLRQLGVRLAIDDAGAGHSSMRHIIHMAPEIIKLDRSLTSTVDIDPVRRSMVAALVTFGAAVNAVVVAEGVERPEEAEVMREMGVGFGQGWHFGLPTALALTPPSASGEAAGDR